MPAGARARGAGLVLLVAAVTSASACRSRRPRLERGEEAVVVVAPTVPLPKGMPATEAAAIATAEDGSRALTLDENGIAVRGALAPPPPGGTSASSPGRRDVYTFTLSGQPPADAPPEPPPPDQRLMVSLTTAATARLAFEIRDAASGAVLGNRQVGPGETLGFANLPAHSGTSYHLAVFAPRGAETNERPLEYVAVVKPAPLGPADEREPNDEAASAMLLPPAHRAPELAGYLAEGGDRDWYRVPTGEVGASTVLDIEVLPPPGLAIGLGVSTAAGLEVAASEGAPGERVSVRSLSPAALVAPAGEPPPGKPAAPPSGSAGSPPSGTAAPGAPTEPGFLVTVRARSGGSLERPYVLSVRADVGTGREREPNGTPATATPLAPGSVSATASGGDIDMYAIELATPGSVSASLSARRPGDFTLEVLLPGQKAWQAAASTGRSPPAPASLSLSAAAAQPGTAYVKVARRPRRSGGDGSYQLTLGLAGAESQP